MQYNILWGKDFRCLILILESCISTVAAEINWGLNPGLLGLNWVWTKVQLSCNWVEAEFELSLNLSLNWVEYIDQFILAATVPF